MLAAPTLDPGSPPTRTLSLTAPDGRAIAADLVAPDAPRAAVLIAPAMGVPRGFYGRFARYLASRGLAALTIDYRGIGGSRGGSVRGVRASLLDWAELDLVAGAELLTKRYGALPMRFVGHSVGGQLMGFVPDVPFDAAVMVASQSGYWRHWDGAARAGMAVLWHAAIPAFVGTLGYLPGLALGGGEDLPGGVAKQWARWGRHPEYLGVSAREKGGAWFARWPGRLRAYAIADDGYAPERSVRALVSMYESAEREVRVLEPAALGVSKIGHFGFFRPALERSLWPDVAAFLADPR